MLIECQKLVSFRCWLSWWLMFSVHLLIYCDFLLVIMLFYSLEFMVVPNHIRVIPVLFWTDGHDCDELFLPVWRIFWLLDEVITDFVIVSNFLGEGGKFSGGFDINVFERVHKTGICLCFLTSLCTSLLCYNLYLTPENELDFCLQETVPSCLRRLLILRSM